MRAIKHVLTERFYTWEDAVKLAKEDPEVDLSGEGTPFTPMEYLEDEGLDGMNVNNFIQEEQEASRDGAEEEISAKRQQTEEAEGRAKVAPDVESVLHTRCYIEPRLGQGMKLKPEAPETLP